MPLAQRDPRQLLLAQPLDRGLGHLAPLEDPHRDHFPLQPLVQRRRTRPASSSIRTSWSWRMCGVAQIASIPSASAWRAIADAVVGVARPVVDRVEDVAVQVDHGVSAGLLPSSALQKCNSPPRCNRAFSAPARAGTPLR